MPEMPVSCTDDVYVPYVAECPIRPGLPLLTIVFSKRGCLLAPIAIKHGCLLTMDSIARGCLLTMNAIAIAHVCLSTGMCNGNECHSR